MNPGGKIDAEKLVSDSKALIEGAAVEEEQLSLIDPLTPIEMAEAQERLGPEAPRLAVMREARATRGRPRGVKNRRTDDFRRYILQFGQDPAITLMQIQSSDPEVLVERSAAMDPPKKRLSYGEAQSMRIRAAETLMPFIHSKQAAVDQNGETVAPLIIAGSTHTVAQVQDIINGKVLDADWDDAS